jgi:hypothetical protein
MAQQDNAQIRKRLAASGDARPDGSFPITKCTGEGFSAENAIHALGRANNTATARAHIKKRVAALGCTGSIFDNWKS